MNPDYTINLEAKDDAKTLYYRVSVSDTDGNIVKGFTHRTENYNEALIYAQTFFDELTKSNIVVASYIEQPGVITGQGALYAIGSFAATSPNEDEFYNSLSEEFLEHCRREPNPDVNIIFRKIVNRHKLNLYKESRLLIKLQQLDIIEESDDYNEHWIEE
jgi:hypothetical protein